MTILRNLLQTVTVLTPTGVTTLPALSSVNFVLTDGTYLTGTQAQSLLGTSVVTATGATIANAPSSATRNVAITGVTTTLTPSNATAYVSLTIAGTEQTPRTTFTGTSVPSLTPSSTGSTTIGIYAASTGGSALATSASFTVGAPVAAPGQVTGLTVGTPASTSLPLTWTAPSTGGAPTGYSVTYTPSGGSATTVATGSASTSYTLSGLATGTAYTITVAATNSGGTGTASSAVTGTTSTVSAVTYTVVPWNVAPPTTQTGANVGSYYGMGGQIAIDGSDGSTATGTPNVVWTKSSSVKPTSTGNSNSVTVDSQYGTHQQELQGIGPINGYPHKFSLDGSILWVHSVPTGNYYAWFQITGSDGRTDWYCMTSAPCVVS